MTKIEEIKELRDVWRKRSIRAEENRRSDLAAEAHNIAYGITLAIRIFTKKNEKK